MKKLLVLTICASLILTGCSSLKAYNSPYSGKTVSYIIDKSDNIEIQFFHKNNCYKDCDSKNTVYDRLDFLCSENSCELKYVFSKNTLIGEKTFYELIYAVDKTESIKGSQKIYTFTTISKTERKKDDKAEIFLSKSFDPDFYLANPKNIRVIVNKEIPSKYQGISGNFNMLGYYDQQIDNIAVDEYRVNINTDSYRATVPVEIFSYREGAIIRVRWIDFIFLSSSYIRDLSSAKKEVIGEIVKIINQK